MITVDYIRGHFRQPDLMSRLAAFARWETQIEGWFKGELVLLFTLAHQQGLVTQFQIEPTTKGIKPDFVLFQGDEKTILELKCGHQSYNQDRQVPRWFQKGPVHKDFLKLRDIQGVRKWILVFMYPKPAAVYWNQVAHFHQGWECETSYVDEPDHLLIGSWRS